MFTKITEGVAIVQCEHRDDRVWIKLKVAKSISRLARDLYTTFALRGPLDSVQSLANEKILCMQFSALRL